MVRIIMIICALFLSPVWGAQKDTQQMQKEVDPFEIYSQCLHTAQKQQERLKEKTHHSVDIRRRIQDIKDDLVEQCKRLKSEIPENLFQSFYQALKGLKFIDLMSPEEYLPFQEKQITYEPNKNDFEQLEETIKRIKEFVITWKHLDNYADQVYVAVNQVFGEHQRRIKEIIGGEIKQNNLKPIYLFLKDVYRQILMLTEFHTSLQLKLRFTKIPDEITENLVEISSRISNKFYMELGEVLWKIICEFIEITDLPKSFNDTLKLPRFWINEDNSLIKLINHLAFVSTKNESSAPKRNVVPGQKIKQPTDFSISSLKEKLNILVLDKEWEKCTSQVSNYARIMKHAFFISNGVKRLEDAYLKFKEDYDENITDLPNILESVSVNIDGQTFSIFQNTARKACGYKFQGSLCFGDYENLQSNVIEPITQVGGIEFIRDTGRSLHVGDHAALYWFEQLCGLPGNPMSFCIFDGVTIYERNVPSDVSRGGDHKLKVRDLIQDPEKWQKTNKLIFSSVREHFSGEVLKGPHEKLNLDNLHRRILWCLLTHSGADETTFGLEQTSTTDFSLRRLKYHPFLQPAWKEIKVKGNNSPSSTIHHQLVLRNILYLLSEMDKEISESAKNTFSSIDILWVLAEWLNQLSMDEKYMDKVNSAYELDKITTQVQNIYQKDALGLSISFLPKTVKDVIDRFRTINELLTRDKVTPSEILKALFPPEYTIIQWAKKQSEGVENSTEAFQQAWKILQREIIYEEKSQDKIDWSNIPVYDAKYASVSLAEIQTPKLGILEAVRALMAYGDLSQHAYSSGLKIMDTLLKHSLSQDVVLAIKGGASQEEQSSSSSSSSNSAGSWWGNAVMEKAKKSSYPIPPRVKSLFIAKKIDETQEKQRLEQAQLEVYGRYKLPDFIKTATNQQKALFIFRHNFLIPFGCLSSTNLTICNAILDLLLRPPYSKLESIEDASKETDSLGFGPNPLGKEGPIQRLPNKGGHFLSSFSEYVVGVFPSTNLNPPDIQNGMRSHCVPLFILDWLVKVKAIDPKLQLKQWFVKDLFMNLQNLQQTLPLNFDDTFSDTMSRVWPIEHYFYNELFKDQKNQQADKVAVLNEVIKEAVFSMTPQDEDKFGTIEKEHKDLDWVPLGTTKNIYTILQEGDPERSQNASAPLMTLDEAAAALLTYIDLSACGAEARQEIIKLASTLGIKPTIEHAKAFTNINLSNFAGFKAEQLSLAIGLNLGCQVSMAPGLTSLKLTGKIADENRLDYVIAHSSNLVELTFENNAICNFGNITSFLKKYTRIRKIASKDNPVHNPKHFSELTHLTNLTISGGYIPLPLIYVPVCAIFQPPQGSKKPFDGLVFDVKDPNKDCMYANQSGMIQKLVTQLKDDIRSYSPDKDDKNKQLYSIIARLEYLAEPVWISIHDSDLEELFREDLIQWAKQCDARDTVYKLFFLLKHDLPRGTVRDKLVFEGDLLKPESLRKLTINQSVPASVNSSDPSSNYKKYTISKEFVKRLNRFSNLTELSLIDVGLSSFSDFPKMEKLTLFNGSKNTITSLKGLSKSAVDTIFPELTILALHDNEIKTDEHIPSLRLLKNLQVLDLGGNKLKEIPNLGAQLEAQLVSLELRDNKIQNPPKNVSTDTKKRFYSGSRQKKDNS